MPNAPVVHSDPEIMGETPVFVGTRVPFKRFWTTSKLAILSANSSKTFQR